ncbi:MAG: T9SS type A sorting domain-containing protein, partial [Bacteroidales bacterium]|nr:T9SS type A sorting domain-containing protein [Bacteroidales bacterium]
NGGLPPPTNRGFGAPAGGSEGTVRFTDFAFYNPIRVQMMVRVANNICTKYFDAPIQLMSRVDAPQIEFLTQTNGRIDVRWDTDFMDARIDTIVILKEATFNQFFEIGRVAKAEQAFIDVSSNLNVRSEAYLLEGILAGGIRTVYDPSKAHQSPRLTITRDGDQNTLIWSQYIGTRINEFTILRGATPDAMTEIATLPGHRVFFVDNVANPGGEQYYALRYDPIPSSEFRAPAVLNQDFDKIDKIAGIMGVTGIDDGTNDNLGNSANLNKIPVQTKSSDALLVQSNIVFAGDASQSIAVERMNILAVQPTVALNSDQRSLFLYPEIFPFNATYQGVEWSIVSGAERGTITANGVLTGLPEQSGVIRVRAEATDGSGTFAERNITLTLFSTPCDEPTTLYLEPLSDSTVSLMWYGTNDNYTLTYWDTLTPAVTFTKNTPQTFYNLEHTDFPKSGVYAWKVEGTCGTTATAAASGEVFTITITEVIPPDWGEWVVTPATCTEAGDSTRTCKNDPNLTETIVIPALGHDAGTWHTTLAATCTIAGSEDRRCTRCQHILETRPISALGHDMPANWTERTPATCDDDGVEFKKCTRCDHEITQGIPKLTGPQCEQTNITEIETDEGLTVYPNPVNYELSITNYEWKSGDIVELFDINGRRVYSTPPVTDYRTPVTIDISHLPEGTYVLRIGGHTTKIIKQ